MSMVTLSFNLETEPGSLQRYSSPELFSLAPSLWLSIYTKYMDALPFLLVSCAY